MSRCLLTGFCLLAAATALRAQTERKEIIIPAEKLATAEQRADKPTPGKWWLRKDAKDWGIDRAILMTGEPSDKTIKQGEWVVPASSRFVPYRVPDLKVTPNIDRATEGWYRIYIGLYNDTVDPLIRPQLFARLSDEPYPEYLRAPSRSKERLVEVYWKAAYFKSWFGQGWTTIHIEQPPAPMPHPGYGWLGGLAYIRLVPRSFAESHKEWKKGGELPPAEKRLFGMFDYTDEVFWWGTVESKDDIRAIVYRHAQTGFGRIYWRAYGSHLDNSVSVPEAAPRWTAADEERWTKAQNCKAGWLPYINLTKKFDPLKVAVEYGDKAGCEVHAWVRFTNHNREPYANFWHDHRDLVAQMLVGKKDPKTGQVVPDKPYKRTSYPRVLSMAYPEVRAYYVKFFKQLASTGTRGIMIDLLRHPPIAGYETVVTEAFKKKYGMEMETRDLYHDPLVQEHLSEYLRLFLVDLRKEIGKDIEISMRCSGPSKYALRGKEWVAEGLINTIVDGNWYSGNGPRPTIDETVKACGEKGKAMAIAEPSDVDPDKGWARRPGDLSAESLLALGKAYSGRGVARFGVYESTIFTYYPDLRRAVRQAGWEFDPKRGKEK
jgi:hypothetical protein